MFMNGEQLRIWKEEKVMDCFWVLSQHMPRETEENQRISHSV